MEEIIVATHRLKELAELPDTPLTRERMKDLIEELGELLGAV